MYLRSLMDLAPVGCTAKLRVRGNISYRKMLMLPRTWNFLCVKCAFGGVGNEKCIQDGQD
jgi:hypothetical protein